MLRTLHQIYKIRISSRINVFLYFLKKLPFLKDKLRYTSYALPRFKEVIGVLAIVYNLIISPLKTLLLFLAIYLPSQFIGQENAHLSLATFIFVFYFILRLISSEILEYDINKFIMVKQMRMDASAYSLAKIFPEELLKLISKAIVFTLFLDSTTYPLFGIVLAIAISATAFISESLHLFIFKKYKITLAKNNIALGFVYMIIIIGGYALALISPFEIFYNIISSPIFFLSTIVLGSLGAIYLYRYDYYRNAINATNTVGNMASYQKSMEDARLGEVKIKDKDYKEEDIDSNKYDNKEGYSYLNAIFFNRHKRIIYRPMLIKSLIVTGVFLMLIIATEFFVPEIGGQISEELYNRFTLFVFVMYILCNSERTIKSMFYNCDLTLLRYGFYKKGDALLRMFFHRLLRIIYSNLIPTTLLALGIGFSITNYTTIGFSEVIPVLLLLYALALFFSVHYIFMYYIFQPFTSSLQVKNPFYTVINFLVYFVSYMLIQVQAPPTIFLPMIISLLVLYAIVAMLLVYKKAPQTFRLK